MPIGVFINVFAVVLGGAMGSALKSRLSENLKIQMNSVLGLCGVCMGISAVCLMKNMPAVIFSVIAGTLSGLILGLGRLIERGTRIVTGGMLKGSSEEQAELMVTAIVLFCASGTGIYGALDSGMTGNHSILITKAILDFFTAMIFACQLGCAASLIGIPQFMVLFLLFVLAKMIVPLTTEIMIADFKACGGVILIATGLRILKLKMFSVADMLPAMVFVMPVSYAWVTWLLPLIGQ